MHRLRDKVAFITGASRGIGRATAELFLSEGADLVLTANRNVELLREFINKLGCKDREVLVVGADLSVKKEIESLIESTFNKFKRVDILVNNAGVFQQEDFEDIQEEGFEEIMKVNMQGLFFLTQGLIPHFKKQGEGKIINVSSLSGKIGSSHAPHYAASKAAVIAFTKSLARAYGRFSINVNAVAPSLIDTEMLGGIPKERLDKLVDAVPLKRLGSPKEVANLILFLASSPSDYITGQVITIDGGLSMI